MHRALGVVHAMFACALAHDLLGRSPFRSINKPRVERTRRRLPSGEQLTRLVEAIPTQYQPMLYCAVVLGVRFSEIVGLRVGAIDTEHGMLSVVETVTRDASGRPVFGPPKSEASRRTMAIPAPLCEVLAAHLSATGRRSADSDALVVAPDGGPIRYANWRNRVWLPACRTAGSRGSASTTCAASTRPHSSTSAST
ncbi:MAG TPA: hypothetical protein VMU73_09325 [Gaiellaceae bacterium]|nr:hypothetical protein [Gaiellaceae bacterium]